MTNKEIVKAWYAALDARDFTTIKNFMDYKYQFRNPMTPTPMGADEHLGMLQMMTSAFEADHHLDMIMGEENHVAVSGKWSGKHTGDFNGVPATGKSIELSFIDTFNIVDGKVVNHHIEFNPTPMMALMGAA